MDVEFHITYEEVAKIAAIIREKAPTYEPRVGLVLGSGYAKLADKMEKSVSFPFHEIPHFPSSRVAGHKGRLIIGYLGGKCVACMQGRFHPYEGHSLLHAALSVRVTKLLGVQVLLPTNAAGGINPDCQAALPVRVMKLLGVKVLLLTNAAGGINPDYQVGDFMIQIDHIFFPQFSGRNPLAGENDERWGPRFLPLVDCYDKGLRELAKKIATDMGERVHEGVYGMNGGPSYETPAEIRMLRMLGCDTIGMSTCHEAITARHCGIKVFAMSMVTNRCVSEPDGIEDGPSHAEVLEVAKKRVGVAAELLTRLVEQLSA